MMMDMDVHEDSLRLPQKDHDHGSLNDLCNRAQWYGPFAAHGNPHKIQKDRDSGINNKRPAYSIMELLEGWHVEGCQQDEVSESVQDEQNPDIRVFDGALEVNKRCNAC